MPVTAKLSRELYDRLGEQVANELVAWLNDVDATYRADLRELNETNFARFDAKVEQRFAEQNARIATRFAEQDARIERRFAQSRSEFADFRVDADRRIGELDKRMSSLETTLANKLTEQTRYFFVAWAGMFVGLLVPIIGLWFRR